MPSSIWERSVFDTSISRLLRREASGVPRLAESASRGRSRRSETQRRKGEVPIRSHVIEASGSSEASYVPSRLFARCGRGRWTARLELRRAQPSCALGWAGEKRRPFCAACGASRSGRLPSDLVGRRCRVAPLFRFEYLAEIQNHSRTESSLLKGFIAGSSKLVEISELTQQLIAPNLADADHLIEF